MIDTIYIEDEIKNHARTKEICGRFPNARKILCDRYGEIFNRKAQNFRLQKIRPSLILAKKFGRLMLEVPKGYGIGADHNYYFSHMMNCMYDCRYCFLQGMYLSAHYVLFVNYEDFQRAIFEKIKETDDEETHFFSGYDCDSLAFESVSKFAEKFVEFFANQRNAVLELRTKSTNIQGLLKRNAIRNCVVAFSLSPKEIADQLENGAPSLERRIEAMVKLQERGWKLGLRFDPVIYTGSFLKQYQELFKELFQKIKIESIHSVSLGVFRLPPHIYERMFRLYPDEKLFSGSLTEERGVVSYSKEVEEEVWDKVSKELLNNIPSKLFFPCKV